MSDAVAHTLDGCEVQPLGEELNPEREELLVDMDVVRERGLEIINTTAYIAITGNVHQNILKVPMTMNKTILKNETNTTKYVRKSKMKRLGWRMLEAQFSFDFFFFR